MSADLWETLLSEQQRHKYTIETLVSKGVGAGYLTLAEVHDGNVTLELTADGHTAIDEFFATHHWRVDLNLRPPDLELTTPPAGEQP